MKNKKGFTLVELIVSFALITAISLAFFRTILSLQQEQLKNIAKNNYKAFTIVLNNSIQKDFLNDNIEKVISCGDSCYDISYTKNGIVRLELDKEKNIIKMPTLSEEQINLNENNILRALHNNEDVKIIYFKNNKVYRLTTKIKNIQTTSKKIILANNNYLYFSQIISVKVN